MSNLTPEVGKIRALALSKGLLAAGGNQAELARKLGKSRQAIGQQLARPYMKSAMSELLDKAGVNDKFIAIKIKEGAEATKFVQIGEENYSREPDFYARHKYLDTALKIKGHLIAEASPTNQNHLHLHLESNREDTGERIRDFTNQLSQNNRG